MPEPEFIVKRARAETALWIVAAAVPATLFVAEASTRGLTAAMGTHLAELLAAIASALIPTSGWFLFGIPPFTYIWFRRRLLYVEPERDPLSIEAFDDFTIAQDQRIVLAYLAALALKSRQIAGETLSRSRFHLLMAGALGFAGLTFFLYTTRGPSATPWQEFWFFLPRVLILLFVELTAGFFLKQYSATMEEFRYYESIARQREAAVASYAIEVTPSGTSSELSALAQRLLDIRIGGLTAAGEQISTVEVQRMANEYAIVVNNLAAAVQNLAGKKAA